MQTPTTCPLSYTRSDTLRRRHLRAQADFFCFASADKRGFCQRERKRLPDWGLVRDFLIQSGKSHCCRRRDGQAREVLSHQGTRIWRRSRPLLDVIAGHGRTRCIRIPQPKLP